MDRSPEARPMKKVAHNDVDVSMLVCDDEVTDLWRGAALEILKGYQENGWKGVEPKYFGRTMRKPLCYPLRSDRRH